VDVRGLLVAGQIESATAEKEFHDELSTMNRRKQHETLPKEQNWIRELLLQASQPHSRTWLMLLLMNLCVEMMLATTWKCK
jgi:hypothetical protein